MAEAGSVAATFTDRTGIVASFDDHVGSGIVADAGTDQRWWFHCTCIPDGTRTVPIGASVHFRVDLGPTGFEAVNVAVRTDA